MSISMPFIEQEVVIQSMNNQQAVEAAQAMGIDQLDAQLLLLHALGRTSDERAWLLAHHTREMLPDEQKQYMALLQRRAIGVPVAYLTGEKEFYGLMFSVDRRVLIPRPDTETLIDWGVEMIPEQSEKKLRLLDLGTGSGVLAVTFKRLRPALDVVAVDASDEALTVAGLNAAELLGEHAKEVRFLQSHWFDQLAGERFDYIVSNPPYIVDGDPHLTDLTHEPLSALVAGEDGLDDLREIIAKAPQHLNAGGWLSVEHGYDQAQAVQNLFQQAGFKQVATQQDLAGVDRITYGQFL